LPLLPQLQPQLSKRNNKRKKIRKEKIIKKNLNQLQLKRMMEEWEDSLISEII
jgi:hypothetical protein